MPLYSLWSRRNLSFADDLLIFTDGSLSSIQNVLRVLKDFEENSGLAISIEKTCFIPLIQAVKNKLHCWTARSLSYAGRLQLITSVINGITNFWASAFILPKAAWNLACAIKMIWLLFFCPNSVWSAWFISNIHWLKKSVGNGETTYFWSSNWSSFGDLRIYLSDERSHRMPIRSDCTLAELWENGNWILPPARSNQQVNVISFITNMVLTDRNDYYEWWPNNVKRLTYSTGEVYNLIRDRGSEVSWHKLVWFSGGIPRHNFFTWLVILNRCATRDRMIQWGLQTDAKCLLCNSHDESINHLFYECSFSWGIWSVIARICRFDSPRNLPLLLSKLESSRVPKSQSTLILMAWQATLYSLWKERNVRLHNARFGSSDQIISDIKALIKARIESFRKDRPSYSSAILRLWLSGIPATD